MSLKVLLDGGKTVDFVKPMENVILFIDIFRAWRLKIPAVHFMKFLNVKEI